MALIEHKIRVKPGIRCVLFLFIMLLFSPFLHAKSMTIDDVRLISEDYPPYNYVSEGELKGFAVEVMLMMLEKMNSKQGLADIEVMPWARGYKILLENANTCLFSITWNKSRGKKFKLVGPLKKIDSAKVFAKKSRSISIRSYRDLKAYRIGVLRHDIAQENLTENGVGDKLIEVSSPDSLAKMLMADRIDLWAYGAESVPLILKRNGFDPQGLNSVFSLNTGDIYYAFNPKTPDAIVNKFQTAFDELMKENRIQPIVAKYTKKR